MLKFQFGYFSIQIFVNLFQFHSGDILPPLTLTPLFTPTEIVCVSCWRLKNALFVTNKTDEIINEILVENFQEFQATKHFIDSQKSEITFLSLKLLAFVKFGLLVRIEF